VVYSRIAGRCAGIPVAVGLVYPYPTPLAGTFFTVTGWVGKNSYGFIRIILANYKIMLERTRILHVQCLTTK